MGASFSTPDDHASVANYLLTKNELDCIRFNFISRRIKVVFFFDQENNLFYFRPDSCHLFEDSVVSNKVKIFKGFLVTSPILQGSVVSNKVKIFEG